MCRFKNKWVLDAYLIDFTGFHRNVVKNGANAEMTKKSLISEPGSKNVSGEDGLTGRDVWINLKTSDSRPLIDLSAILLPHRQARSFHSQLFDLNSIYASVKIGEIVPLVVCVTRSFPDRENRATKDRPSSMAVSKLGLSRTSFIFAVPRCACNAGSLTAFLT